MRASDRGERHDPNDNASGIIPTNAYSQRDVYTYAAPPPRAHTYTCMRIARHTCVGERQNPNMYTDSQTDRQTQRYKTCLHVVYSARARTHTHLRGQSASHSIRVRCLAPGLLFLSHLRLEPGVLQLVLHHLCVCVHVGMHG